MSFPYDDTPAWTSPEPVDFVRDALKKEKLLKDIAASQEDLRGSFLGVYSSVTAHGSHGFSALVARVRTVQKEVDKLTAGNETLQMYIDNLTMQMAKRR